MHVVHGCKPSNTPPDAYAENPGAKLTEENNDLAAPASALYFPDSVPPGSEPDQFR